MIRIALAACAALLLATSADAQVRVRSTNVAVADAYSNSTSQAASFGNQTQTTINDKVQAPGLGIAGLAASGGCLGSASGGVSGPGFGVAFGSTTPDADCRRREQARVLAAIGGKRGTIAAMYLLSLDPETREAMGAAGMIVVNTTGAPGMASQPSTRSSGVRINGVEQLYR